MSDRREGASVEGNVDTGGGDFVGRDQVVHGDEVRGDKVVYVFPDSVEPGLLRIRYALVEAVRTIWIEGLLDQGVHQAARVALGLERRPGAVRRPWVLARERGAQAPQALPPETTIDEVWRRSGRSLLILGAPGAGKTFTLVELAQALVERAGADERAPVPLLFNLSSWAGRGGSLFAWLVEELFLVYGVSRRYGPAWLQKMHYALLLDGLDEVPEEKRAACVEAIHTFLEAHGPVPLAVCSRTAAYETLAAPLATRDAIQIQPLNEAQIDAYLAAGGERLAATRAAVRADAALRELARTPLMLNILALTYGDRAPAEVVGEDPERRRRRLFDDYVARMFTRKSEVRRPDRERARQRLAYLARRMRAHEQSTFYMERLHPDWLPGRWRSVYRLLMALVFGMLIAPLAGLFTGLIVVPLVPPVEVPLSGAFVPLFGAFVPLFGSSVLLGDLLLVGSALVAGLVGGGLLASKEEIEMVELMSFSWRRGVRRFPGNGRRRLGVAAGAAVAVGLVVGAGVDPFLGLLFGVVTGLVSVVMAGLGDFIDTRELQARSFPNQGMHLSARNSVRGAVFGLVAGAVTGAVTGGVSGGLLFFGAGEPFAAGLFFGVGFGLFSGLISGLAGGFFLAGGQAVVRHAVLRLLLALSGRLPLRLRPFLERMTQRILMQRVGGGYMFIHRVLLAYFAEEVDG